MTALVPFAKLSGDWRNNRKGRVIKCPHCGYQFRAFIALTDARCPKGHRMAVLTNTARGAAAHRLNGAGAP